MQTSIRPWQGTTPSIPAEFHPWIVALHENRISSERIAAWVESKTHVETSHSSVLRVVRRNARERALAACEGPLEAAGQMLLDQLPHDVILLCDLSTALDDLRGKLSACRDEKQSLLLRRQEMSLNRQLNGISRKIQLAKSASVDLARSRNDGRAVVALPPQQEERMPEERMPEDAIAALLEDEETIHRAGFAEQGARAAPQAPRASAVLEQDVPPAPAEPADSRGSPAVDAPSSSQLAEAFTPAARPEASAASAQTAVRRGPTGATSHSVDWRRPPNSQRKRFRQERVAPPPGAPPTQEPSASGEEPG
jgi:hypothetical protein